MHRPVGPIGHCSEKLRKAVEIDEQEALLGTVRIKRRPKKQDEDEAKKAKKGSGRFSLEPDFQVPGPFSSRPLSTSGHVSFHFSRDTVTKVSDNVSIVSTSSGSKRLTGAAPADHDGYIGRPGAVMALSAAEFEGYAVRGKAVEEAVNGKAAVISNISADPQVRRDFWLKVHKHERTPEPNALEFRQGRLSTNDWVRISTLDTVPANVRQLAAEMATPGGSGKGKSKPDAVLQMDQTKAAKVIKAIRDELGHWNGKRPPVRLRKGRGGRTQFRLTAEFAEGLDGAARLRIATEFCARLGEIGVMYTAAIHEPDEHNNEKNFHLHVAYYDRPARIMPGSGLWDFEVCEKVPNQHERYRYPERQPKIGKLVRNPDGGNFREYAADQIYGLRELFAQLSNEELKKAGSTRLFDPRTYKEMGIDQKPTRPLGPKAASLQAVGIPTVIGTGNAEILGTAALQQVRRECAVEAEQRAALRVQVATALATLAGHGRDAPGLAAASARFEQAAAVLDAHDLESREYNVWLHIVEAGPAKAVDTCSRILSAIEAGKATRSDQRQRAAIEARKVAAEAYLVDVGGIHESNKETLKDIRRKLGEARECLADVVPELTKLLECEVSQGSSALVLEDDLTACPEESKNEEQANLDEVHPTEASVSGENERKLDRRAEPAEAQNDIRNRLDELLKQILDADRPITLPDDVDDRYRVPGIARHEYQLLNTESLRPWVQQRLAGIAKIQRDRMNGAARYLVLYGEQRLRKLAETQAFALQAITLCYIYGEHPTFQQLLAEAQQKVRGSSGQGTGKNAAEIWKSTTAKSVGGSLNKPRWLSRIFSGPASVNGHQRGGEVETRAEMPTWTPAPPSSASVRTPADDRVEALAALADEIRTGSDVKLVEVDGALRVDPASMPDWQTSLEVFGEERAIREAVEDRRKADNELRDAPVRQEIIKAVVTCTRRPVRLVGGKWEVTQIASHILDRANEWQSHPDLTKMFERVDQTWRDLEARVAASLVQSSLTPTSNVPVKSQVAQSQPSAAKTAPAISLKQQSDYLAAQAQKGR